MGKETEIAWCDSTFNPWIGCQKVSSGCDRCYAEELMDTRYGRVEWGQRKTETTAPRVGTRVRTSAANWRLPLRWAKAARATQTAWESAPIVGRSRERPARPRVFCSSLADVFDNQAPAEWREDLFHLIEATPELDWLLLTKRPENIRRMLPWLGGLIEKPWPNVWLGFTAEDQEHFDRRWPIMREIPAAVRFCSYEPAIGPLRLLSGSDAAGLDWLICGGESGHGHRSMDLQWEENIRFDCERIGVSYFFKQLSGKRAIPADFPLVRQFPEVRHG